MSGINPINVNPQGIGAASGFGAKPQAKEEEKKEAAVAPKGEEKAQLSGDKVLSYMAQSAAVVAPKKLDPSKYVDKASEERIAGFMANFEDQVAAGLKAFDEEFSGVDVSDSTKMTFVLAGLNEKA